VFLEWDEGDREKALTFKYDQQVTCSSCGTRPEEWDPTAGGNRFAYVSKQHYCHGCDLLAQERENVREDAKGVTVYLVANDGSDDGD
jgi:hypothetical protein